MAGLTPAIAGRTDVVVIGGGISGLAAAYRLQAAWPGIGTWLLEAADRLGGQIATHRVDGFLIEEGPDSFLSRKPAGVALCAELEIDGELIGRDPRHARTYVRRHGRLHDLPAGLTGLVPTDLDALRRSTLISPAGRERLARERHIPPGSADSEESIAAFMTRRLGHETFENLVEPLLAGIYAGKAERLSMAATFPRLIDIERRHGSLLAGLSRPPEDPDEVNSLPPFVSFREGMQRLVAGLTGRLGAVDVRLMAPVDRLVRTVDGFQVFFTPAGGLLQAVHCKAVILATPAYISAELLSAFDPTLAAELATIPYASTALVNLAFRQHDAEELPGYGYVVPRVEERPVLACTWTSRKWPGRAPDDCHLLRVYIGRYGSADPTVLTDQELLAIAQEEIDETLGLCQVPLLWRIFRAPKSLPQYNLGHNNRQARIRSRLKCHDGLLLAGAGYDGIGIPDCIRSGEAAAAAAVTYLR